MNDDDDDELEDLSPANFPKGGRFLADDFYWDCTDENSPFGNDDGADTFSFFREWRARHPRTNPLHFLEELLENWQVVNDFWEIVDRDLAKALFDYDYFSFKVRDNALVAVAFGQLLLDGKVHPEVKRLALLALDRQSLAFLPWHSPLWIERLQKMKAVLQGQ